MNISYVIVADSKYACVSELPEETNLVVQLQEWMTAVNSEDILRCQVHHPKYAS